MNKAVATGLGLLIALASPAIRADPAADALQLHLRIGRAQVLARRAAEAWEAGRREGSPQLRLDLLGFAGASRVAADALSSPELPAAEVDAWSRDLRELAARAQASFDRTRTSAATRDAWTEARRALADVTDPPPIVNSPPATSSTGSTEPTPSTPAVEPAADPDAPRAAITNTRWAGTFTPDLVVSGRVEGRGLRRGYFLLKDSSGKEVFRSDKEVAEAIALATQGAPGDGLATAVFSVRIDSNDLANGENTIVMGVTDAAGRTAEATERVTKRLF